MKLTVYHNGGCSKSRATLELLERSGVELDVVEYLLHPPDEATLDRLLTQLGLEPAELARKQEDAFAALGLDRDPPPTRTAWLSVLAKNPILIERPIVTDGRRAVIGRPPENVLKLLGSLGPFEWVRRMGEHEAYHRNFVNRLLHWVLIPVELLAVLELLSQLRVGSVDLGVLAIAALSWIFLAAEPVAGALMCGLLAGLWRLTQEVTFGGLGVDAAAALGVFMAAFLLQTQVGHGVFERGIDDTAKNLGEFRRTRNPVPLVLVFFYHLVELLFAAGYRRGLRARVALHTRRELEKLAPR